MIKHNNFYKINLYKPSINFQCKKYVNECLNSNWISSKGKFINLFENEFKKYTKIKYCATVSNATVGLHLALLALGIKSGDEIIVPTFTYIASVNCIKYVNAKPIFVDSDINNCQIDLIKLKKLVNKKTKAIIIPHLYGAVADLEQINKIRKQFNFYIIEDCAEALGSFYKKKHIGNFGDVSVFSFFGSKTITTGEGGMVCSNNKKIANEVIKLKGQGLKITADKPYYWHDRIGYNYRMTNICAAIGYSQIKIIDDILKKKRIIFESYKKQLCQLPINFIRDSKYVKDSKWLVVIFLEKKSKKLFQFLKKKKIETRPTFQLASKMPMYGVKKKFPNAEELSKKGLCLPSYPDLQLKQIKYICDSIKQFLKLQKGI
jgi:perosamine synthetase